MKSIRKGIFLPLVVFSIGVSCLLGTMVNVKASQGTIYVDDDNTEGPWDGTQEHPYRYIQDGIDAASNNYDIFVYSGTYYEKIYIDKSVSLVGEDKLSTYIDASNDETSLETISINSNDVKIEEFSIVNNNPDNFDPYNESFSLDSGFYCAVHTSESFETKNIEIKDCIIKNNYIGIKLHKKAKDVVLSNLLIEASIESEFTKPLLFSFY